MHSLAARLVLRGFLRARVSERIRRGFAGTRAAALDACNLTMRDWLAQRGAGRGALREVRNE